MRPGIVVFCLSLLTSAYADEQRTPPYKMWYLAPAVNLPFMGSQDERAGVFVGYQTARPEKRLRFHGRDLTLVFELNFSHTYGGGWRARHRDKTWNTGFLGLARYEKIGPSGRGFYYDFGWGVHFASESTWDLDSRVNSTPTVGAGMILPDREQAFQIGLRFYHISNAGFKGSNQGQNQLLLQFGVRF